MKRAKRQSRRSRRRTSNRRPDEVAIVHRRLTIVALLITVAALVALDRAGLLAAPTSDAKRYDGATTSVVRVIDGDTVIVEIPDPKENSKPTRVRLWGVDAPELARNGAPAEEFAVEAKDRASALIGAGEVILRLESHRERDRWGRVLAHVELANGDSLAAELIEAGLVEADDRWPHRWDAWYERIERDARRSGVGMWAK